MSDNVYNSSTKTLTRIAGNGISSPFTGATASSDGIMGAVPAPSAGDQGKYLKADGTWATVSGSGSGGHTIKDETSTFTQRANLKFVNATVSDDSTNDATVVTVSTPSKNYEGTLAAWNLMTDEQRAQYDTYDFSDDFNGMPIDATPTANSTNPVQSGGVYTEIQTLANSLAPIENGTNYSTTYYKNDEFWHNGVLCKVTASSVNSSTAISIGSDGNAIIINSFDRLHYVDKNISLTCAANSFTRVNVPIAAPETASTHRVAVAVQNEETVSAVLCGLGRVMLFTTATKTDASIELRIWYQD